MAVTKRLTRREMREYRLTCTGLDEKELFELYHLLKNKLDVEAAFRNPFLPHVEPHTVHEILLTGAAIAGATGTKVLDLIAGIVKRKLEERDAPGKRSVTIYDDNDRPYSVVELKPPKPKRWCPHVTTR
jgi:hypothetical protein